MPNVRRLRVSSVPLKPSAGSARILLVTGGGGVMVGSMFWRWISVLGVMFWAVMTGLLVRDAYFPEESRFAEVPPEHVLQRFLDHGAAIATLVLMHHEEKAGQALITVRQLKPASAGMKSSVYDLQGSGTVEGTALRAGGGTLTWRFAGELDAEKQDWRRLVLQTGWRPETNQEESGADVVAGTLSWSAESGLDFEVREGGRLVMDTTKARELINGRALPFGGLLFSKSSKGGGMTGMAKVKAREGVMMLAGKRRKSHVLELEFMGLYQIKLLFTEAGELARADLPQGWVLLEPTIHGLGQ